MTDVEFAPKEVIESGNRVVEILSAETTEQYGPQLAIKLKVVGGEHDGYTFTAFYKRGKGFQDLVGCRFMAQVSQTKTGSRNKLEHGTIGPAPKSVKEDLNDLPF